MLLVLVPFFAFAERTSTNYIIKDDSFQFVGGGEVSSTNYALQGSVSDAEAYTAQPDFGDTNDTLVSGYIGGLFRETVRLTLFTQDPSSQVAVTSVASDVVTLTDSSGFSVGEQIIIVADENNSNPDYYFGIIESIDGGANTVTIQSNPNIDNIADFLGDLSGIDGSNDYVYSVTQGSGLSFGTLSDAAVAKRFIAVAVTSDIPDSDFTVYASANGAFTSGSATIDAVSDGSVTAGSSEFGARSSDSTLANSTFDTEDSGFSTTAQEVLTGSNVATQHSAVLTLKAAIPDDQDEDTYSIDLDFTYVGDF
jgi:hypothetical protein